MFGGQHAAGSAIHHRSLPMAPSARREGAAVNQLALSATGV